MKTLKRILIILILGLGILFISQTETEKKTKIDPIENVAINVRQNVENYLRKNISELSSTKAVLGGTWYVVSITTDLEKNSGTVIYEDGHIQETKNFSYTTNSEGEVASLTFN